MGYLLPPVVAKVASTGALPGVIGIGLLVSLVLILLRFAYMPLLLLSIRARADKLERRQTQMDARMSAAQERFAETDDGRVRSRLEFWRVRLDHSQQDVTAERDAALGWRDGVVLGMAGMRGVVTIAAAQTLPGDHPQYTSLVLIAFVVAIATLLPQGLLLPAVVSALHLRRDSDDVEREQFSRLMHRMRAAGVDAVESVDEVEGGLSEEMSTRMRAWREEQERRAELMAREDAGQLMAQFGALRRAELTAERSALAVERRRGEFSSEAIARVQRMLDDQEIAFDQQASGS